MIAIAIKNIGGMVERLNAAVLKTVDRVTPGPRVRIPIPPPVLM